MTVTQYLDLEVGDELVICPLEIRKDPSYIRDYILLANLGVMVFLPGILLVFTNAKIYRYHILSHSHGSKWICV